MSKIIKWYKKQKSWVKGGIIGLIAGFLPLLIIDSCAKILGGGSLDKLMLPLFLKYIIIIYILPATYMVSFLTSGEPTAMNTFLESVPWYFLNIIFYGFVGILTGIIIQWRKK